ncbi:general amidase [Fomitiporia mediterranea MF3/22]|uniref:general amidase n=1 Tax=Fomitiporia mediterranea (strain MF3/22) TaxID=694068 RepID=UPI0004408A94|nr:general amidase [Fomitiporia mediterranea MF3/22]EJD03924.1 general amidase [Fomitiporia mediterranea MF3/22]
MPSWQELVADKQQRQKAAIPREWLITPPPNSQLDVTDVPRTCGILTPQELAITETEDVAVLLTKLASGEWTSVDVTRAFYKRAIIAQQVTNCLTEIFVERALARAAECDRYLKENGKPIGHLHGLPVSLKDQVRIKGLETTMGYVSWIGDYAERDATLTTILYEAGAVPFVRTNIPQTLMYGETHNSIFGRTVNPLNRNLTCGGSSGGEGALIAMKGSPLGVGSDIGGSIRIPSAFCGVYGLRPSYNRIPYEGSANSIEGQDSVPSVLGPLSTSLSGVKAFTKAVVDLKPWAKDPLAIRKAWDEDAYQLKEHGDGKDLCFAILWSNGSTLPTPPIHRSLEITKKALETQGIKVIDWPAHLFDYARLTLLLEYIWGAGSAEDYAAVVEKTGEPILTTMALDGVTIHNDWFPEIKPLSAFQLWQYQKERAVLRKQHLDLWESTRELSGTGRPVDAIICPVAPLAAAPHGKNVDFGYTGIWNGLDYPACTFPVSKVDLSVDLKQPRDTFLSKVDEFVHNIYEHEEWKNAPTALQLVGRTLEEEAVIAMTEIVDRALKAERVK